jgi:hypothetical protein
VPDRSRLFLFLITLTALPLIVKVASLMVHGLNNRFVEVLPIVPTLMGVITVGLMLLYAVEVMRPNWLRWRHFLMCYITNNYGVIPTFRLICSANVSVLSPCTSAFHAKMLGC